MKLLKIYLKVFIIFTAVMLVYNYIFIKTNFRTIIITSLVISTLNAVIIYNREYYCTDVSIVDF